ncbi:hypothetical protein GNZ10_25475, partial [Ralstonia sp. 3N]|uniref:reprolysin-like metallopeptidase n=1 Tax=Ralstonia sp. 3N TaxID=2675750 RepID=UPI0015C53F13
ANVAGKYEMSGGIDPGGVALRVEIRQTSRAVARLAEMEPTSESDEGHDADVSPVAPGPDAGAVGGAPAPAASGVTPVVDVVVGYARSLGDQAVGEIGRRLSDANDALARSQANVRLALVSVLPVDYAQHPTDLREDLNRLRQGQLGLDALQNRRTELNADLVALIVPNSTPDACGYGHVPNPQGDRRFGDTVTAFSCFSGHTFAHELGHNLGANHDRESAGSVIDTPFPFSYGHRVPGVIRTVMAYNCPLNCPRTLQFSNPNVRFVGYPSLPSGTATADNARSISVMAPVIAAYRDSTPISRIAGGDRFQTAAAISRHGYPNSTVVDTVLVATGLEFPDALSAAPLAAKPVPVAR